MCTFKDKLMYLYIGKILIESDEIQLGHLSDEELIEYVHSNQIDIRKNRFGEEAYEIMWEYACDDVIPVDAYKYRPMTIYSAKSGDKLREMVEEHKDNPEYLVFPENGKTMEEQRHIIFNVYTQENFHNIKFIITTSPYVISECVNGNVVIIDDVNAEVNIKHGLSYNQVSSELGCHCTVGCIVEREINDVKIRAYNTKDPIIIDKLIKQLFRYGDSIERTLAVYSIKK